MERINRNKVESREYQSIDEEMSRNFLDISETELQGARERIQGVQGHVRIVVHPLYLSRHPGTFHIQGPEVPRDEVDASLTEGFEKMVRSVAKNDKSSPLLVFEEHQFVQDTKQRISNLIEVHEDDLIERGFLFLETDSDSGSLYGLAAAKAYEASHSVPPSEHSEYLHEERIKLLKELEKLDSEFPLQTDILSLMSSEERLKTMRERIEIRDPILKGIFRIDGILKQRQATLLDSIVPALGIKSGLIAGGYFYNYPGRKAESNRLGGCAGGVTTSLRERGVRVDISRFSWSPREYLQEQGIQTRQTGRESIREEEAA